MPSHLTIQDAPSFLTQAFPNGEDGQLIAQQNKFGTLPLCQFDLEQVRHVLGDFIRHLDIDNELKQQALSLYTYISKILELVCNSRPYTEHVTG